MDEQSASALKIKEIIKKYNLEEKQTALLTQLQTEKDHALIKKICEEMPLQIVTDLIFKLRKKTILPENVESIIKNSFGFNDEISKKITEDVIEAFKIDEQESLALKKEFEEETIAEEKIKKEKEQLEKSSQEEKNKSKKEENLISEKPTLEKPIVAPLPKKETPMPDLSLLEKDPYRELPSEDEFKLKF